MKILHLISSGGFFGAEQVLLNLAGDQGTRAGYANTEHIVGALHNLHNPHLEIIREAETRGLPTAVFECGGRFDLRAVWKIRQYCRAQKIDIIHTHNYKADIFGFFASANAPVKRVATNHVWHGRDFKLKYYEKLDALALRAAHAVIGVSGEIADDLARKGIKADKVSVIQNGVDVLKFAVYTKVEARQKLGISDNEIVVSVIGRLNTEKNHALFLQAAAKLAAGNPAVKFLIVGDGELRSQLEGLAGSLGLWSADSVTGTQNRNAVVFTGIQQDMPLIYAATDILVNSSTIEGLPMTILEAMAAKVPVVATRVGGVPDLITHDQTGLLVQSQNADELAQNIALLVNDSGLRTRLAQAAYEMVCARYSVERMREEYRKIYERIIL